MGRIVVGRGPARQGPRGRSRSLTIQARKLGNGQKEIVEIAQFIRKPGCDRVVSKAPTAG